MNTPHSKYLNKTVVITGGTDGIGKALVLQYLHLGANVVTCGRNQRKILDLEAEAPMGKLCVLNADVAEERDCIRLIGHAVNLFGGIDILINNAGISMRGLMEEGGTEIIPVIKKVMDINFYGSLYCTTHALPHLIRSRGVVVGVSSIAGYRGLPGRSGYSASKFALQGWLESIKTELVAKGVHVMWVSPGFTASNIRNAALNAKGDAQGESPLKETELMGADTCAAIIIRAVAKRKRTVVMTFQGKQTVFLNRFFPSLADKLVRAFFFRRGELVK
jgi:NAD(P)-dependent dehydrogenase (short-subunit alcohol dehydrogenase family)